MAFGSKAGSKVDGNFQVMANASDHRIPDDISDAFGEAVVLLVQWKRGTSEPLAILKGKSLRITTVFDIVIDRKFTDPMPESMVKLLLTYASKHWPASQFRLLARLVQGEAWLRQCWAHRKDRATASLFNHLRAIALDLRLGRLVAARRRLRHVVRCEEQRSAA